MMPSACGESAREGARTSRLTTELRSDFLIQKTGDSVRRILSGDLKRAPAGVRVRPVLRPAVLLAFGWPLSPAGLDRPAAQHPDRHTVARALERQAARRRSSPARILTVCQRPQWPDQDLPFRLLHIMSMLHCIIARVRAAPNPATVLMMSMKSAHRQLSP